MIRLLGRGTVSIQMEVLERLRDDLQTAYEDGDIITFSDKWLVDQQIDDKTEGSNVVLKILINSFCGDQYVMIDCPRHLLEKSTRNSVGYFNDVISLPIPEQVADWFAKEYVSTIVNC